LRIKQDKDDRKGLTSTQHLCQLSNAKISTEKLVAHRKGTQEREVSLKKIKRKSDLFH